MKSNLIKILYDNGDFKKKKKKTYDMDFSKVKNRVLNRKKLMVQNNSNNNNGNNMSMHEFNYCKEPKSMTFFQLIFVEDIYHPRHARVGPKLKYAILNS